MFVQIIRIDLKNSNSGAIHITTKNTLNIPGLGIFSLLRNVTYIYNAKVSGYFETDLMGLKERERQREAERERVMHRLLTHKHVQRSKHHMILHNTQTSS